MSNWNNNVNQNKTITKHVNVLFVYVTMWPACHVTISRIFSKYIRWKSLGIPVLHVNKKLCEFVHLNMFKRPKPSNDKVIND